MAPFTVLHVCMGNICRSPMAERLLARAVHDRVPDGPEQLVRSVSAGTGGWHEGEEMNPPAARQVSARGGSPDGSPPRARTWRAAGGFISSPSCQPPVPALWLSTRASVSGAAVPAGTRVNRCPTARASSRSAIGDRQMLPMHTCRTVNGGTVTAPGR